MSSETPANPIDNGMAHYPPPAPTPPHHVPSNVAAILAVIMMLLALIGAGAALANASWAERYWLYLVPIYGVICTIAAWFHTRRIDRAVIRQILHWCAVGLTILVDFNFLHHSGEQTATATGLSSLLLLALGCLLAGIHLEWMFALVGLLLLATAVFVSVAQEYMALVLLIGVILIGVILATHHYTRKWRG
jgi:hypothetical protein